MKTNKEKAEEVLRRVNTQSAANESVATKPLYSQKAKISFIAMAVAFVITLSLVLGLVLGLQGLGGNFLDLDKMYIANFESYTALGAGAMSSNSENVISAASEDGLTPQLICMKDDGTIEKARYKEHKEDKGEGKEIPRYLSAFYAFKKYTFVSFSVNIMSGINERWFYVNDINNSQSYLIDNETGRFYSLNIKGFSAFSPNPYGNVEFAESETSIYLLANYTDKPGQVLFQTYVENDTLVLKERTRITNEFLGDEYYVDIYDNLFVEGRYGSGKTYFIDKQGKVKEVSGGTRNLSGRVYVSDTDYYGQDGEIVRSAAQTSQKFFYKDDILKKEGNVWYCVEKSSSWGVKVLVATYKVTWKDEFNYSIEKIVNLEGDPYAITKDYIYFYKSQGIYKVDIKTGARSDLKTDKTYIFVSISTDNLGNVLFEAYDEFQNKVTGVINNEGQITVDVEERKIEVYYIQPLR